jgi:serine/threonine-protein kinase RsbW
VPTDRRRNVDVDELLAAERAAGAAGEPFVRWWRGLAAAAENTLTSQSLDNLLREAMVAMKDALEVDTVALLLANESGDELVARAATGLSEELSFDLGIRAGEGMAGLVLASRQPLIVADLATIRVVSPVLRDSGLRSIVAVPMLLDSQTLGVLYAGSYELDNFDKTDADVLQSVADRLAIAVDRVRLFETEHAARQRAEKLADRLGRMQRATARLASVTTVDDAATVLVDLLVADATSTERRWAAVWLRHDDRLDLVSAAADAGPPPALGSVPVDDALPLATACRDRKAVHLTAVDALGDAVPIISSSVTGNSTTGDSITGDAADGAGPMGIALLPIVVGDVGVGVAAVGFGTAHPFGPGEREFLTAVTAQAALAVDRARLLAQQVQLAEMSSFLARAAKVLAEADDLRETLDRLAALALPALGEICLIDVIDENGDVSRMVAKHRDPASQHLVDRLRTQYPPEPGGRHPAVDVIQSGHTRWSTQMPDDFLRETTRDDEHYELTKTLGFRSYMTVPLVADGRVVGSVTFISAGRAFGDDDVAFAERLAEQVAAVVDNARRYDVAYRTSHILQSSLLPRRLPVVPGLTVETRYRAAAEGLEVGGDFYDLIALPSGRIGFMVGDVAGHDRDAAALMGHLRSAARALAGQVDGPVELVAALKRSWELLGFDRLATGLFGQLDPPTGEVVMASAGHYPPLLVDDDGARFLPLAPIAPLGVDGGTARSEWRGRLRPGQVLLLYTDGVIDERRVGSDESMRQLTATATAGDRTPAALCERVVRALHPDRVDDVALMALQIDPDRGGG